VTGKPASGIVKRREELHAVNVILSLDPEVEKSLTARALARGISLDDYLQELVSREAGVPLAPPPKLADKESRPIDKRFDNLSDFLLNSPLRGANLDFSRAQDHPRAVECHAELE
jgi:hypothetical protein